MAFENLSSYVQNLYLVEYEYQVKIILLFGFLLLSFLYRYYLYPNQKPTKIFFLGTLRALIYGLSVIYIWLFWLIIPVMINPNVSLDNLLIFIFTLYGVIFVVFGALFLFNATVWIPKFIINFGKIDIENFESDAFESYFGKIKK